MNEPPDRLLTFRLCDAMLRRAPVNVLLFDTELICRYAAPVGDELFGRPRDRLIGRRADQVWPPAANGLQPVLERAARDIMGWENREYRFRFRAAGRDTPCCWSILVEPLVTNDYRGVLVYWLDVLADADERARLSAQVETIRQQQDERTVALLELVSDLRNLITPISGYLQLIVRRPAILRGRSPARVIAEHVLPRLNDLVATIDRLRRPPIV